MRADLRRVVAAGLFLTLALGGPLAAAHADETVPPEPAPIAASAPAADEPSDEPTPAATEPSPSTPAPTPSPSPTPDEDEPSPEPTTPPKAEPDDSKGTLKNAQLRWSLNALLHQAPHFGKNFITAGTLADNGGAETPAGQWKQAEGAVRVERASGSAYVPATWDGFGTGADHQVVIDGGTGTIDAAAGSARIAWRGSFGVARYSGLTAFSVSDPVLTVENGVGTLTARLSGFGVSRDGNGAGATTGPIAQDNVVLADLGRMDLTGPAGFSKLPTFYGVRVAHAEQKADDQGRWGSFPASFISFVDKVGQAPFWMTSGSDDDAKAAAPVSVSLDASTPVAVTPPTATRKTKKPKVSNPTSKAPPAKSAATPPTVPLRAAPAAIAPAIDAAPTSEVPASVAFTPAASLTAAPPTVLVDATGRSSDLGWWIAATFLLMAAGAIAAPSLIVRPRAA